MAKKEQDTDKQDIKIDEGKESPETASAKKPEKPEKKEKEPKKVKDSAKSAEKKTAEKLAELQDKYLRLSAEFDNYRKRTLKERIDLQKSANEELLSTILPVMDDFERAMQSIDEAKDIKAVKEGIHLIFGKFSAFLNHQGIKEIEATNKDFDTDIHEAVTKIPAPDKKLKGKVVDVVQKGYYLNEKVLRYSKVVIGE